MSRRNEKPPAIGIDLGTSYSCVGIWWQGHIEIIPNDQGSRMTPSCVAFTDTERLIGETAVNQGRTNSSNTIFDAKRLIGRRFNDEVVQKDLKHLPYKVIADPDFGKDKKPLIVVNYMGKEKRFSAEEISAMVLTKMKDIAEDYLGMPVTNAVVTVPAYFTDSQRQATKNAGAIAGLNVLQLINEPTAAAIAYCFDKNMSKYETSKKNVLVFDLGGGTFDVSLVSIEKDKFEVKSVNGDTHLGGIDFDNRIVSHFVEEFKTKYRKDVCQSPRALGRLRVACEKAKRTLSLIPETNIELDYLYDDIDFSSTISRECFENINADLFQKCIDLVEQCLSNAHIGKNDVDDIILVGGSTRIPKVQQLLQEFFDGKELSRSINPDEAVAYGAALHAAILCGITNYNSIVLHDVTPLSLGVEVGSGDISIVIPRNTIIPTRHKWVYGAKKDRSPSLWGNICRLVPCLRSNGCICRFVSYIKRFFVGGTDDRRTSVSEIHVYEGEKRKAHGNNPLGVFEVTGISPYAPVKFSKVWLEIDVNGILSVSPEGTRSGSRSEIKLINRHRLTNTEVDRMKNEAKEYKAQDKKHMEMVKAKNTLEDYANDMSERLSNFGHKIGAKDKKTIMDAIEQIFGWLNSNSKQVLDEAIYTEKQKELESICQPFNFMKR